MCAPAAVSVAAADRVRSSTSGSIAATRARPSRDEPRIRPDGRTTRPSGPLSAASSDHRARTAPSATAPPRIDADACAVGASIAASRTDAIVAGSVGLRLHRLGQLVDPRAQRGERPAQGAADDRARAVRTGQHRQPAPDRRDDRGRQQALVRAQVRDDEQRRPLQPVPAEPVQEVAAHRRQRRRRDPVEHHRDRRATLDGALQDPPRQRVAVAGSGRHEEPQVGRLEQPVRRLPVRLQHRVEVRGVQQRDAARHLLVGDDASRTPGPGGATAAPRRAGCAPAPAGASSAAAPPPCSPRTPPTSSPASTCPHRSSPRSPRPPVPTAP